MGHHMLRILGYLLGRPGCVHFVRQRRAQDLAQLVEEPGLYLGLAAC